MATSQLGTLDWDLSAEQDLGIKQNINVYKPMGLTKLCTGSPHRCSLIRCTSMVEVWGEILEFEKHTRTQCWCLGLLYGFISLAH